MDSPIDRLLSPEGFAEAFEAASRSLWTLATGLLGDSVEAEDVVQEAALLAFERRHQFQPGTHFGAWLGTFVRNVARNAGRKRARRSLSLVDPVLLEPVTDERATEPRPPVDAEGRLGPDVEAFDDELVRALDELTADARACLLLRVLMDHTYGEIAALLNLPEGTVASHVHRARTQLRKRLEPEVLRRIEAVS